MAAYTVCVDYKNNARFWDDSASGRYEKRFATKRDAWNYILRVEEHADAKPYITVDVIVVDLSTHEHVWRNVWNVR